MVKANLGRLIRRGRSCKRTRFRAGGIPTIPVFHHSIIPSFQSAADCAKRSQFGKEFEVRSVKCQDPQGCRGRSRETKSVFTTMPIGRSAFPEANVRNEANSGGCRAGTANPRSGRGQALRRANYVKRSQTWAGWAGWGASRRTCRSRPSRRACRAVTTA